MTNTIALTINIEDADALQNGANVLADLAADVRNRSGDKPNEEAPPKPESSGGIDFAKRSEAEIPPSIFPSYDDGPTPAEAFGKNDQAPAPSQSAQGSSAAAPTADAALSAAAPGAPSSDVELDADGMPWDARIHARTKTKNKDETWRTLRGVDPGVLQQVTDELKAKGCGTASAAPPPPAAQPPEQAPPPPPPAEGEAKPLPPTWGELVQRVMAEGIDFAKIEEAAKAEGLPSAMGLHNPDLAHMILPVARRIFGG